MIGFQFILYPIAIFGVAAKYLKQSYQVVLWVLCGISMAYLQTMAQTQLQTEKDDYVWVIIIVCMVFLWILFLSYSYYLKRQQILFNIFRMLELCFTQSMWIFHEAMNVETNSLSEKEYGMKYVERSPRSILFKLVLFNICCCVPVLVGASTFIYDELLYSDIRYVARMNELHSDKYNAMILACCAIGSSVLLLLFHFCLFATI